VELARCYVICCVQRTGSWLLAHTLADTGYAGRPSDYFDEAERENHAREWGMPDGDLTAYIRAMRDKATTPNGVLGSKMMWNDFDWLRSSVHSPRGADTGLEFMRTTFPDAQFVWLRREDKVRQGISWWRADVTDQWALRPDQEPEQPALDVDRVMWLVQFAERCEDGWRQWFASTGIQPCEVVYEDLARDRLAVANRVLQFLHLPHLDAGNLPPVRPLPQAGRQPDRPLRGSRPLGNDLPRLIHAPVTGNGPGWRHSRPRGGHSAVARYLRSRCGDPPRQPTAGSTGSARPSWLQEVMPSLAKTWIRRGSV
jgi:LPS sulfotransferase NodH